MNSLTWKQWRESKRYLALFLVWMLLAVAYCIAYELGYRFRAAVGHFSGMALFYTICASVFLAMRTALGERTEGTLSFSASLPVSLRRVATVRILGAIATMVIPILVASCVLMLALVTGMIEQAAPRDMHYINRLTDRDTASLLTSLEQLASVTMIASLGGVHLLLILCLCGCWLRSQAQVGFLGAIFGLGSIIASGMLWYGVRMPTLQLLYGAVLPQSLVVQWSYGMEVGGYTDHELFEARWVSMALAIPVLMLIAYFFTRSYGRMPSVGTTKRWRFRFAMPPVLSRLSFRLPSRLLAMVWLELRQSLPLVSFGLVFALLITIASLMIEPDRGHTIGESLRAEMPHSVAFVGMLWAVVVGAGLFAAELRSDLGGFWRSRPIPTWLWFSCKFCVGLAVVVLVLDGVTILVSWSSPNVDYTQGMSWAYIGCFPMIHAFMFALSVLGTCWSRKPVIGGMFAILGFAVLLVAVSAFPMTARLEPIHIYNRLLVAERSGQMDFTQFAYPFVYGTIGALIVATAVIASWFARPLSRRVS